jgi:hypothetical protein
MRRAVWIACLLVTAASTLRAADQIDSIYAEKETRPETNPDSRFWRGVPGVVAHENQTGDLVPGSGMEVRSRWTHNYLYFLFISTFQTLNLNRDPRTDVETNKLWQWDVAEAFIGSDFNNIRRYKEFEVSPQGEWVDLDINLNAPHHEDGWVWNSGFNVAARINRKTHTWYGFMRIPYSAIDSRPAAVNNSLRANFFLSEGAGQNHVGLAWEPTHRQTFHVPEAFGTILLSSDKQLH